MHARLNKRLNEEREGGFTLIELLIVIIILGILAAIVVFAVGQTRGDAVTSACETDYKSIELAVEAYNTKEGTPPTQEQLSAEGTTLLKSFPDTDDYGFTVEDGDITVVAKENEAVAGGAGLEGCAAPAAE